ncbi:MAG: histidinol-phosphate transaminase [Verrucomicrobiae bacterium]|nr:histidinol-phosphate transaminase [Verrucomicrobiae bacterium]
MSYIRPNIERMHGYVPGEQPKLPGLIKLNTNENPYPPSPKVIEALRNAVDERLRFYPDPQSLGLRQKLGRRFGFDPAQILIGNGCDDILNLCVRAFVGEGETMAYFWPSYSLYPVLADIQNARKLEMPLDEQFQIASWPSLDSVRLLFITQPNAPSGVWLDKAKIRRLIGETSAVVVLDEAYVDFAGDNCLDFVGHYPNVLVARSLSKSYALAGMRLGWVAGPPKLIAALDKVKDSYNVNCLSQIAGEAAVEDAAYFEEIVRKVKATRERVRQALLQRGFEVFPSQTNFLFARPPAPWTAKQWFDGLRARNVLVRWWDADRIRDFVRVSIGSDEEMDKFLEATDETLR